MKPIRVNEPRKTRKLTLDAVRPIAGVVTKTGLIAGKGIIDSIGR